MPGINHLAAGLWRGLRNPGEGSGAVKEAVRGPVPINRCVLQYFHNP